MKPIKLLFATSLSMLMLSHAAVAQIDSSKSIVVKEKADTTAQKAAPLPQKDPKKAALLSAALPGTGQIYNRKYWKLPLVYGALGTSGYLFFWNRSAYREFKRYYVIDADTNDNLRSPYFGEASLSQLRESADQYRTWMEYSAIAFSLFYVLQIVDATVDAHLFYFDVSDDLSLRVEPMYRQNRFGSPIHGVGLHFQF